MNNTQTESCCLECQEMNFWSSCGHHSNPLIEQWVQTDYVKNLISQYTNPSGYLFSVRARDFDLLMKDNFHEWLRQKEEVTAGELIEAARAYVANSGVLKKREEAAVTVGVLTS